MVSDLLPDCYLKHYICCQQGLRAPLFNNKELWLRVGTLLTKRPWSSFYSYSPRGQGQSTPIKSIYCQVSGMKLSTPTGPYAEACHHTHSGPDSVDNILCLSPNMHVLFNMGAIALADEICGHLYHYPRKRPRVVLVAAASVGK
jgi:hypothetical protein